MTTHLYTRPPVDTSPTRLQALLLRYVAATLRGEALTETMRRGIQDDFGLSDQAFNAAVARIRAAVAVVLCDEAERRAA
jgi:hypothetical protein